MTLYLLSLPIVCYLVYSSSWEVEQVTCFQRHIQDGFTNVSVHKIAWNIASGLEVGFNSLFTAYLPLIFFKVVYAKRTIETKMHVFWTIHISSIHIHNN